MRDLQQENATLRAVAAAVMEDLSPTRRATFGLRGVDARLRSDRITFRPRVRFTEMNGRRHRIVLANLETSAHAVILVDLASMILGREPLNHSRQSYATLAATADPTTRQQLARLWSLIVERLSFHVSIATTERLQARLNPFRQQATTHHGIATRASALH